MLEVSRFVAVGDSFTEGMCDVGADGDYLGWADRVAAELAPANPGFRYANLAIRGRKLPAILAEQMPIALALQPDLVSLAGGTNDLLRPSVDLGAMARDLDRAVSELTSAGSRVLMFTGLDPSWRGGWARRLVPRVMALNAITERAARRHGVIVVDLWDASPAFADPRMWAVDRLHLTSEAHYRVTQAVLETLGYPYDPQWRVPLAPVPATPRRGQLTEDVEWVREHLGPWVHRRLTGRSSGDGLLGKQPTLGPVLDRAPADRPDVQSKTTRASAT